MPERQPPKSGLSPSPFQFGILLFVIALAALVLGLSLSGVFGTVLPKSSFIKQAQAVESQTPEISPTVLGTETIVAEGTRTETLEPSATQTAKPKRTKIPPADTPAAAASLTPEPSATQAAATFVAVNEDGSLVYSNQTGELYVQRVNKRGKAIGQPAPVDLSSLPGKLNGASVSPGGKDILLDFTLPPVDICTDACEPVWAFAILSLPSNKIEVLEKVPPGKFYGWHPDGKNLIFGSDSGKVHLFNVRNKKSQLVANVDDWLGTNWQPVIDGVAFSPDGNQMIVAFDLPGEGIEHQAWIADSEGSNARKVMESKGVFFGFTWSPDGNQIAFLNRGLEVIDRNGENRRMVSRNFSVGWGFLPRWSPDSTMLAFEAHEELPPYPGYQEGIEKAFQSHKMHIVDLASLTERRVIPDEQGGDIQGAWSPDSKRMALLSNRNGSTELWLVNLQNNQLEQISADGKLKRTQVEWLKRPLGEEQ